MAAPRTPRSIAAATALAERFAAIEGAIGAIEGARNGEIAEANASADQQAEPLLTEREAIREKLAAWWPGVSAELTKGKRKSIELGGCIIGSRKTRETLVIAGPEDDVIALLRDLRWAKPLVRVKYSIDRVATLKAIDGSRGQALAELGIERQAAAEVFTLERAEQAGVRE